MDSFSSGSVARSIEEKSTARVEGSIDITADFEIEVDLLASLSFAATFTAVVVR
jgi:hypothetical protein